MCVRACCACCVCLTVQIREHKDSGIYVEGMSEHFVTSPAAVYDTIRAGTENRAVASTNMNRDSSRSHSVFIMYAVARSCLLAHATVCCALSLMSGSCIRPRLRARALTPPRKSTARLGGPPCGRTRCVSHALPSFERGWLSGALLAPSLRCPPHVSLLELCPPGVPLSVREVCEVWVLGYVRRCPCFACVQRARRPVCLCL
jgi:hypothetical protein